jgi:hypothetical protein
MMNQALFSRLLVEDEATTGDYAAPFSIILAPPAERKHEEAFSLSDKVDAEVRRRAHAHGRARRARKGACLKKPMWCS